ncbi:MAG: GH36-type glycosyl hydrolase domain-containing protein [Achromobacter veterisilvae]
MKPMDWPSLDAAPEWIDIFTRTKSALMRADSEPPLRAELFSASQMERHGQALARAHVLGEGETQDTLLQRLSANQVLLSEACALLVESMSKNRQITPADEWLLDNFYLIEEQIRLAKRHLPKSYSRSLPKLAAGPSKGLPRVYDIALEMISHSDARIDSAGIGAFVAAYQSVAPLQLGELWAIPIMMRLALIESLRRVAIRLAYADMNRGLAGSWADTMRQSAEEDPTGLILVIANMARSDPPIDGAFVAELAKRLQGHGPALALPLTWFEQRLAQSNLTIEQMVVAENQQQASDQVSISNSIGSLRALSSTNWSDFVEAVSIVDLTLREDPAGAYARMDFATRDRYRHRIERLARSANRAEIDIARMAIGLAAAAAGNPGTDLRKAHVGFYLIDEGQWELARLAKARLSLAERLGRISPPTALRLYAGAMALLTAGLSAPLIHAANGPGAGWGMLLLAGVLSAIAASHLAVATVNWALTWLVRPQRLPRMDYSTGIPDEARCLVAVPTMLIDPEDPDSLSEALEIRFLANPERNLGFCLLTDFADAPAQRQPQDAALLNRTKENIRALNAKYSGLGRSPFFLFHRPRRWNPQERTWMGHERKRGKLADLNGFLRGAGTEAFCCVEGDIAALAGIKYVITLDTDTDLPRESAWKLVGAMAHPLNRPHFDPALRRVTKGYGILQPRVAVTLGDLAASPYAQLFGGEAGIDPYTNTVSDVYQDIFKEGSFIGKGIYDVDAFEAALKGCFPDNRVLSHDLLEGCYARSGLLSDVQLYEGHPARYAADVSRRHRWIRGDWQLLGWLYGRTPTAPGGAHSPPLSPLARGKILDNLRRSLVPASLVALLALGWTALPRPWLWTAACLIILFLPAMFASALNVVRKAQDVVLKEHLIGWIPSTVRQFARTAFSLATLAHEALYSLDAIVRTLYRLAVSRRRLLEWKPSSVTNRAAGTRSGAALQSIWAAPVLAVLMGVYLALFDQAALAAALPILLLWVFMPAIAWRLSRSSAQAKISLSAGQELFLKTLARKTWAFFEMHGGARDNWLIPDNIQDHPTPRTAHRTSPTNMGLALLSNLAAYDFGYIQAGRLIERTQATLGTMAGLERYLGHFYNWYDTVSLKPLAPLYVSTVDSGNLAGHLLTLRQGLLELAHAPILQGRTFAGIADTLAVLRENDAARGLPELERMQEELASTGLAGALTLTAARPAIDRLCALAGRLAARQDLPEAVADFLPFCQSLLRQCEDARDELARFAPPRAAGPAPGWLAAAGLDGIPTLRQVAVRHATTLPAIRERLADPGCSADERNGLMELVSALDRAGTLALERSAELERLAGILAEMAVMEYGFLYDKGSRLLAIGYNLTERRRDEGLYDLLASEARLCSFVAIAQGQLPQETWFALGRQLSTAAGRPVLLSWSGSMFEYLMPLLVMPSYPRTLLDQTCLSAVRAQIEYGNKLGIPWGISECAYNLYDVNMNYQYRAFGVPGLGLKRGLADDVVVAPYASMLALMVAPDEACQNLLRLAGDGLMGRYGLYEAIDYTPRRLPRGKAGAVVYSYMAHHQGMGFISLADTLLGHRMQARFDADPSFKATMLLLQERVPRASAAYTKATELSVIRTAAPGQAEIPVRVLDTPHTSIPEVQLLSNGRYHVMVTNSGGGSSRWKDLAVTRWREDGTCDNWGTFCYLRDVESGESWSTTYQPTLKRPDNYEVIFSEGRAEFRRSDWQLDAHTEIVVSPEDDIELRRCRLTNRSRERRTIEITSYSEAVIAPPAADDLHPAFSNLFVQTEAVPAEHAILCTRRRRSLGDDPPWMFQLLSIHGGTPGAASFETDRSLFIGRGRSTAAPSAIEGSVPLSGSQGAVLDPVLAIRRVITLAPEETAVIDLVQGVADNRGACMNLIRKYQDRHLADRALELAWTHAQITVRQLNTTEADAQLYARLANAIVYQNPTMRAEAPILLKNRRGQSGLWGYAISGDLPIVLLRIKDPANFELVRQLVQAHAYWRQKGVAVDLVIWNEDTGNYRQVLQDRMMGLISAGVEAHIIDRPGGIFVRPGDQISEEDRILLQAVSRVSLGDGLGTLSDQVNRLALPEARMPPLALSAEPVPPVDPAVPRQPPPLMHGNGLGGFTLDGEEYVTTTTGALRTPVPWVNVIANPGFGTVVSESGQAYSWCDNAHEFRLTPWTNDSVTDACGEAFYLRDEASGAYWSAASYPTAGSPAYTARHGFGYTTFEHIEDGIESELCVYVAEASPVKFFALTLRNRSGRQRRLSATGYLEWVLGDLRAKSSMHVTTDIDPETGALFARNTFKADFAQYVVYFDTSSTVRTMTGDRKEFIGRNGTLRHPQAMRRARLSGRSGAGLDPCAAIQVPVVLEDGQEAKILFHLGASALGPQHARQLIRKFRESGAADLELQAVRRYWRETLDAVRVETPVAAVNTLANGWLLYQTLACRLWARSGHYQSAGAYGFRDQLQDVMALAIAQPALAREHLLRCAARQFVEGDVQHWWHPPSNRGVRTRCSDDYLWLPFAVCHYVGTTGDERVLDEDVRFIEGRRLNPGETSNYDHPASSAETATLYHHCTRAISLALNASGPHGLPLIGSCDWNDGMDKVGEKGLGESVWLGFFLYDVLERFSRLAVRRGDRGFAGRCDSAARRLRTQLEQTAWDGHWYRRAYFDDGTPLGSSVNPECRIDSIAQSWAVMSGAAGLERARSAMEAVDRHLVDREYGLIRLLTPSFDASALNPGYIRGYVPGVRENGGQYTHAAIWTAMAFCRLRDEARTGDMLRMLNPINHSDSPEKAAVYKVEPYVMAADIYTASGKQGRGGWTWYTGSSGLMYRYILEFVLGMRLHGNRLSFHPCLPADWDTFKLRYRFHRSAYLVTVARGQEPDRSTRLWVDGAIQDDGVIRLVDDGRDHEVSITLPREDHASRQSAAVPATPA